MVIAQLKELKTRFVKGLLPSRQTRKSNLHLPGAKSWATLAIAVLSLNGCAKYQMTLNETVVYTPPTVITDFETEDPRLKDCFDQIIKDGQITDVAEVTQLICSHAGLTSLKGIEYFYNLQRVNLGNNEISDLAPIRYLSKLEVLLLNDNQIKQAPELLNLPRLGRVDLNNNPDLECGDLKQFADISSAELTSPSHCL